MKYPYARQFVDAYDTVTADYQWANDARDPQQMFLHDVVGRKALERCGADISIRAAARSMLTTGSDAIAVVDGDHRVQGAVTRQSVLAWVAAGDGTADQPISGLLPGAPPAVGSSASVIDGMLALAEAGADALAVTSDGSSSGQLQALVTSRDIARVFGDQPVSILREIRLAAQYAGTARAQSPRARIRPSVPHQRRLARLAGTLRLADRRRRS